VAPEEDFVDRRAPRARRGDQEAGARSTRRTPEVVEEAPRPAAEPIPKQNVTNNHNHRAIACPDKDKSRLPLAGKLP